MRCSRAKLSVISRSHSILARRAYKAIGRRRPSAEFCPGCRFSHRHDLALEELMKLGGSPRAQSYAIIDLDRNELAEAAARFAAADVPEAEKAIADPSVAIRQRSRKLSCSSPRRKRPLRMRVPL